MEEFNRLDILEYKRQVELGQIQRGYRNLMDYLASLRTELVHRYPEDYVVGNLYQGYLDMSYFSFTPKDFKPKGLKLAIVFNHRAWRFEVWLVARNKDYQRKYWNDLKKRNFNIFPLCLDPQHAIIQYFLVENPDFSKINELTDTIDKSLLLFVEEIHHSMEDLQHG